uniref:Epidermal growth factor receptor pathway substrate 15 n=1 Tax=Oncorhynchus mykiss TaxID=8022 RepID=A0A8C7QW97_ONCMY
MNGLLEGCCLALFTIIKCVSRSILCLSPQLSSGNPLYDKYYRQVDPSGSGRVAAADAALFLKRSGLADLVLGKIWDLADSERKGCLNDQQFFIALRLVACAQNGLEVALKSLNLAVPPPKFHDTSSPLLPGGVSIDSPWVVKTEEKLKFDAIFESLSPVGGMLSGEKVKPVLLNSKLPVDVLGRVWELSDLDRDGMLDRDEFAVVMYLVYRALEGEPIPMSLPATLVPPSKRKKLPVSVPPVMPLLPSPPSIKERRSSHSGSKTLPSKPAATPWAVSPPDKAKYDEVFAKTDLDMDGLVSGPEVRDIFLKTGLPSATLARIWELCDIGDIGKLTREQFALALHLINQKLTKGVDPPQNLCPEMIPPSDRLSVAAKQSNAANLAADFSAIKELDSSCVRGMGYGVLQRLQSQRQEVQDALEELDQQKTTLEEQLGHIRQQCSHENQLISSLEVEHAEQEQRIEEYEEQLVQAREELLRLQEETQHLEEKVQAAREQLTPLQESVEQKLSDLQLEERTVTSQLSWKKALEEDPVLVNGSVDEQHQEDQAEELRVEPPAIQPQMGPQVESPEPEGRPESTEPPQATPPALPPQTTPPPLPTQPTMSPTTSPPPLPGMDFFQSDPFIDHDPFKDDPFGKADVSYPFGGDPFKGTDPFAADSFFKQSLAAPFPSADSFTLADPFSGSASLAEPNLFAAPLNNAAGMDPFSSKPQNKAARDPFSAKVNNVDADQFGSKIDSLAEPDPFGSQGTAVNTGSDPDPFAAVFGNESFGLGFADFSALAKSNSCDPFASSNPSNNKNLFKEDSQPSSPDVPPALPPKTGTPTRPPPPPPGQCSDGAVLCLCVCFCVFLCGVKQQYPTEEDMIEWATRESEREEKVRLARQAQQEQEDLELAIALSKSEFS